MGVSSTTIQRWEADANAPYFEGAVALARALEVPIEALAVAYGDPAPTTCYAPHLSLVPELPGQCELDLTGAEPVLRLHAGHGPDRQRAVARRSLAATRLHAVT
jgi:transcriptional regulator with XRE-family HTH domain